MAGPPFISIVVPSLNQGKYLGETLASLSAQRYPNLEVIIQDGGSTDGSVDIARRFAEQDPACFKLSVEKDRGQAHALNLGFAKTRGEILGFLNSDDTLFPGCLDRVARELDPTQGRHVVMGRCLFTGEDSPYVGVEHPSEWNSFYDHLAIWERGYNTVPQPSVFWSREVWERCGGFDEQESHVLDYDLFCKMSRYYRFHKIDELWSTYRMHPASKSAQRTESDVLNLTIAASRKHWGYWWEPIRWRCSFSHLRYRRDNHERARHHARRAEDAVAARHFGAASIEFLSTAARSPRMAWHRLLLPHLKAVGLLSVKHAAFTKRAYADKFTGKHADSWIGPFYREERTFPVDAKRLIVVVEHKGPHGGTHRQVTVRLYLDGQLVAQQLLAKAAQFSLVADVSKHAGRNCIIEIKSSSFFVPHLATGETDTRQLSVLLLDILTTDD